MAGEEGIRRIREEDVALNVGKMDVLNYAMYLNNVPPINNIRIQNLTRDPLEGLALVIQSEAGFFEPYYCELPPIPVGKPVQLSDPELDVNGKKLAELTETVKTDVRVALVQGVDMVTFVHEEMKVLTYEQFMGLYYCDLLPSYVMPNHPVVTGLLHDTAMILSSWQKKAEGKEKDLFDPALEGYQSGNPNRVRILAAAAYAAIQQKNIVYAEPPQSGWVAGQRIRTPEVVMEQRLATCMDFTLLYASCLEAIGLHPILYLIQGHIFAGFWLYEDDSFNCIRLTGDNTELVKLVGKANKRIDLVECTAMRAGESIQFTDAEKTPDHKHLRPDVFECAIDVTWAREKGGVMPLPSRIIKNGKYETEIIERKKDEITAAPKDRVIEVQQVLTKEKRKITNKKDLWETKLLDLSPHNIMIDMPVKAVEQIMSSYVDEVEDALADGEEFVLYPVPPKLVAPIGEMKDDKGKVVKKICIIDLLLEKNKCLYQMDDWEVKEIDTDFAVHLRQEARNHRLYTYCMPAELDKNLTAMYRAASSSQQENGVSNLYLAIGVLRWVDVEAQQLRYAPLVMVPIEMVRKSANQGYAFHRRDEEPYFNLTLLEMMKQNHNIDIGGLDPLPRDEHGVDIKKIFAIVRSHLQTMQGWDVYETCVIGNFSFAQFAMWNDIHLAGDMLNNSGIVRSLMKGHVDWDVKKVDETAGEDIFLPITVDGTQLEAIRMAAQGKTFVLHGPPGTGKSQTITGMIANLVAHGKRVLFVAEKMAALSVVERRLSSLGIGDFCLELHSDKANKKHVLTQLDKALSNQGHKKKDEFEEYLKKFNTSREKLDQYMKHLHETRKCGYSMYELIDLYETTSEQDQSIPFTRAEVREMTREQIRTHKSLIGKLTAAGDDVRDPLHHPLRSVGLDTYSFAIRSKIEEVVPAYLKEAEAIRVSAAPMAEKCGKELPGSTAGYTELLRFADCAVKVRDADAAVLWLVNGDSKTIRQYLDARENVDSGKQVFLKDWNEEFLKADMNAIRQRYEAAEKKLIGKGAAVKAVAADVQRMAKKNVTSEMIPIITGKVKDWQEQQKKCQQLFDHLSSEEKEIANQVKTVSGLTEARDKADTLRKEISACQTDLATLQRIAVDDATLAAYRKAYESFVGKRHELNEILARDPSADNLQEETVMAQILQKNPSDLKAWSIYIGCRHECQTAGLEPVIRAYESGMPSAMVYLAYRKGLYYALINEVISTDEVLSMFSGSSFNESVRQFKQIDDALIEHTKVEIFNKLVAQIPTNLSSPEAGMELNQLRKAIGSNARGMSIRELFEKLSHIIQLLCPVMLMSPNSVAQYLERKNDVFDVVIFDEASQLPTCKAVGALARAKAAVIVGDPKQMPPTSFFAGNRQIAEDVSLEDLDSILDDALALGVPSQYLQWHYRSTHESLIAFSNHEFYGNKMFTFPSANDRERRVKTIFVDGAYRNSVNEKEAQAIVRTIREYYEDPEKRKLSIGVVTFNVKQLDVIYNLLQKQFQKDRDFDAWANNGEESLFIKNLENVQGDERDVIMFSIGYGPDEKGNLSMNFGPINKTGGGKRLNVAFSRARVEMLIFTSMNSSQIRVNETSPDGLKAFKDFLHYAEGNSLGETRKPLRDDGETGDGIMSRICSAIREKGFECQTNIGQSSFHVDIAVVDPYDPTQYLMGILLDGENYRMTGNTRDREIAQASVLRRLGWKLLRVWTIDWWDNAEKQLNVILEKLEEARKTSEQKNAGKAEVKPAPAPEKNEELEQELAEQTREIVAEEESDKPDLFKMEIPGLSISVQFEKAASAQEEPSSTTEEVTAQEFPEVHADPISVEPGPGVIQEDVPEEEEPLPETAEESEPAEQAKTPAQSNEGEDPRFSGDYRLADYVFAELPDTPIALEDYVAPTNRKEIIRRAEMIVKAEAPIRWGNLMWRTWVTFGVKRSTKAVEEATEKALRAANIKKVKTKGVVFCWDKDTDPNAYKVFRVTERNCDDISPHEIKNCICYTLMQHNGKMDKDELIFAVSRNLGYKRLGKYVESTIADAIQFAKSAGIIEGTGQISLVGKTE